MSDNELIARIISNNDRRAFAELMGKHQSPIRHFLRRLTAGDHALADDIAQDAFLLVFQKLSSFRGQAKFSTWLHQIAYRCFLRNLQKAYHRHEVCEMDFSLSAAAQTNIEADIAVEQLMSYLASGERVCITLSYSVGMSHNEISAVTGFPLGTVKSHINRGKQKLVEKANADSIEPRGGKVA